MTNRFGLLMMLAAFILCLSVAVHAGVTPSRLNYQGLLTDANGQPMNATGVQMTFRIWNHPIQSAPANLKWEETILVDVTNGLFNVILGDNIQIEPEVFDSSASYLGIQIGTDPEGEPRTRLVSVGYSTRVETLDGARGGVISGTIGLQPATGTKDGDVEQLRYEIFDEQDSVKFWASKTEVFVPCVQFSGDDSRQCTAAMSSGAAQVEDNEVTTAIGDAPVVLAQQSIDCPSDGYVLVLGSCEAAFDRTSSNVESANPSIIPTYAAEFGVVADETEQVDDQRKSWLIRGVEPFLQAKNVISLQKVFAVEAGSSTFYLVAERTAGDAEFTASDKTLTLVFIPKAYGEVGSTSTSAVASTIGVGKAASNSAPTKTVIGAETEISKLKTEVNELRSLLQQVIADRNKQ